MNNNIKEIHQLTKNNQNLLVKENVIYQDLFKIKRKDLFTLVAHTPPNHQRTIKVYNEIKSVNIHDPTIIILLKKQYYKYNLFALYFYEYVNKTSALTLRDFNGESCLPTDCYYQKYQNIQDAVQNALNNFWNSDFVDLNKFIYPIQQLPPPTIYEIYE